MKKLLSMLLCGALLLSGCGASSSNTTGKVDKDNIEGVTKIKFWYAYTDKIQENNENMVKKFNETVGKEKGIEVIAEYQGSYDDVHQKLQAAHISGEVPAVSVMEIASIETFANNGLIVPLDEYIQKDNVDTSDFYEGLLENCIVNDNFYGLPYLRSTPILYLNTTLLSEAGLNPEGPKTWEELETYARTIKEKTGKYGISMYSYDWVLEGFFLQHGTSILSEDRKSTNLNTDEGKEIFTFFQNLAKDDIIRTHSGDDSSKVSADILNQNAGMWFASTADLTKNLQIAEENNFEINTAFLPKAKEYGVPTGGCNLVITSKASDKEKQAAWEFIKWITSPEQAAISTVTTGYVPTSKTVTETEAIQNLFKERPQFKVALDQLESYGHGRPMNKEYVEAKKELINVMDAVFVNLKDVNETLKIYQEKIDNILQGK